MATYFRTDGWVKTALGAAIPGAQIYVCNQPANIPSNLSVTLPSPLATIFSDVNGLVPIAQPIITDGFGHYDFYTSPGAYTVIVAYGGIVQRYYPDQSVGNVSGSGSGGSTSLAIEVNGALTTNQLLANFIGTGGTSVTADGAGGITINSTSVVFSTSGQGWLAPTAFLPFVPGTIGGVATTICSGAASANVVGAVQFMLPYTLTISSISMYVVTGGGIGFASAAIYDSTGTTRLVHAGANAFDTHTASQALRTVAVTPVTLTPGIYWFATASTDAAGSALGYTMYQFTPPVVNANVVRYGTAANAMSAGSMPASLGVVTGFGTSSSSTIPLVMFGI